MECKIKELIINSKHYPVEELSQETTYTGLSSAREGWIKYNKNQSKAQLQDTLLHEAIHIIDYDCQLNLSESQVHTLATQIYSLFQTNPIFAKEFIDAPN